MNFFQHPVAWVLAGRKHGESRELLSDQLPSFVGGGVCVHCPLKYAFIDYNCANFFSVTHCVNDKGQYIRDFSPWCNFIFIPLFLSPETTCLNYQFMVI